MKCPKCDREVVKQGENLFDNLFGILSSHSIVCDWRQSK